jgi:hypothetical protein
MAQWVGSEWDAPDTPTQLLFSMNNDGRRDPLHRASGSGMGEALPFQPEPPYTSWSGTSMAQWVGSERDAPDTPTQLLFSMNNDGWRDPLHRASGSGMGEALPSQPEPPFSSEKTSDRDRVYCR